MNEMHVSAMKPRAVEPFGRQETVTPPTGQIGILLVDDQHELRHLLGRALSQSGFRVVEAASGEEALERLAQQSAGIQLLVTDVIMPGINGAELARRVLLQRPDMKVLFISGCAGHILEPGAPFLQKPFSMKVLLREVETLLADGPVCVRYFYDAHGRRLLEAPAGARVVPAKHLLSKVAQSRWAKAAALAGAAIVFEACGGNDGGRSRMPMPADYGYVGADPADAGTDADVDADAGR